MGEQDPVAASARRHTQLVHLLELGWRGAARGAASKCRGDLLKLKMVRCPDLARPGEQHAASQGEARQRQRQR
jgi:hypothetical protein